MSKSGIDLWNTVKWANTHAFGISQKRGKGTKKT